MLVFFQNVINFPSFLFIRLLPLAYITNKGLVASCPCLTSQYITKLLAKMMAHVFVHVCPLLAYTLSQMNPEHTSTFRLYIWQLNIYQVNFKHPLKAINTRRFMNVSLANVHHSFIYRSNTWYIVDQSYVLLIDRQHSLANLRV